MKYPLILFFVCFCLSSFSFAQDSVWYHYDLTYYKIQTAEDGIYRIYPSRLKSAGISLQWVDPRCLRLYHRGVEVAIHVAGEQDGRMDPEDYLDFIGKKNEEWISLGIINPNPFVNTYSDTTAFFLVYTPGEQGKRMEMETPSSLDQLEVTQLQVFADEYSLGETSRWGLRSSTPKKGQGWMSSVILSNLNLEFQLDASQAILDSTSIFLELGWVGRSSNEHRPLLWVRTSSKDIQQLPSPQFSGFELYRQSLVLRQEDVQYRKINLQLASNPAQTGDYFSLAFAKLTYSLPKSNLRNPENSSRFTVDTLQAVHFRNYQGISSDYLIVGHGLLELPSKSYPNPLQAYASYRASRAGGSYHPLVIRMEDLYDQFAFGEKTPRALHEFLKFYFQNHQPRYLLLAGRALVPYAQMWVEDAAVYQRNIPDFFLSQNLVPTGGFPPSDSQFVRGLNQEDATFPAMAVGRIPAKNGQELSDYLDKVKENELLEKFGSQKIIHLVGGMEALEIERHQSFMEDFASIAKGGAQEVEVVTYVKQVMDEVQHLNLTEAINLGVTLLTYFGHGSLGYNELDFGYVSNPTLDYANAGHYPMLLINGCEYGNAFGPSYSQGEDWLISPKKGAIAVLANSSLGVDLLLKRSTEMLYRGLFDSESATCSKTLGEILLRAEREFTLLYGQRSEYQAHWAQLILLGDPALQSFFCKTPNGAFLQGK